MKQYNEILNDYVEITADMYPIIAAIWGIKKSKLSIFSKDYIHNNINRYKNILKKIDSYQYNSRDIYIKIRKACQLRIYELNRLESWSQPYFYVDHSINTISMPWEVYNGSVKEEFDKVSVLLQLENIGCFFEIAKSNLSNVELAKFDCFHTIQELTRLQKGLFEKLRSNNISEQKMNYFKDEIYLFQSFLKDKVYKADKFYKPLGEEIFKECIYLNSGILIDFDLFLRDLSNHIILLNQKYPKSKVTNRNNTSEISISMDLLKSVLNLNKADENLQSEIIKTINVVSNEILSMDLGGKYCYTRCKNIRSNELKGVMIYDPMKLNSTNSILGVVHEIYPGHHYSALINSKVNFTESIIFTNEIFEEGWAKYCEKIYAYTYINDQKLIEEFELGIAKSILLAIAAIYIHVLKTELDKSVKLLSQYFKFDNITLKNACLQAYLYPLEGVSYILGYYFVSYYFKDKKFSSYNIEDLILNHEYYMEGLQYEQIQYT
ncbi:hypothetical protein [Paenibacillus polymyxa]|uniref:hypothetical protein n=1 Tax=Paenibacillus polymyxa TaxID=1406 RepID=UPI00058A1F3A|nr:hypothetical protein [Paenibacillus polymyxa]AJE51455.1 hypothetical protein RE92_10585 [Paenibacillus polymyxa]QOH60131.1 hypothetical protein DI243_01125 [Paenibacillus polymyxa]